MAILEIKGLRKKLNQDKQLKVESLILQKGETLSIVGESGTGKTSLLRCIAGLDNIDQGTIKSDDEVFNSGKIHVASEKRNIGLVFQDYALFPHMTLKENIIYASNDSIEINRIIEIFQLGEHTEKLPEQLSGGLKQRAAIARSLASKPKVLMLDEPFSNIDYFKRAEISKELFKILEELAITVIFVTHHQEEAMSFSDKVAIMKEGELIEIGTPEEIYLRPKTKYTATFLGETNFISTKDIMHIKSMCDGFYLNLKEHQNECIIRPEDIELKLDENGEFEIISKTFYGHDTDVLIKREHLILQARILGFNGDYKKGSNVNINIKRAHIL